MKKHVLKILDRRVTFYILMLSALAIFSVSCEKEKEVVPEEPDTSGMTITEILESYGQADTGEDSLLKWGYRDRPTFRTLTRALIRTRLIGKVAFHRLTVFAPTDKAFAELGLNPRNIVDVPNLKEILLYHLLGGVVFSDDLEEGFVPTLNGAAVEIKLDEGVMVNDANVTRADIWALNGVIHIVDKVLIPPDKNLVELALSFDPEFAILVEAVIRAELDETLATGGPFTVFAPTNDAFVSLLDELGYDSLNDIPVDVLTKVLLYHVVEGRVFSSDLVTGPVTTLNGVFQLDLQTLTITDANDRESGLVPGLLNVQATNGVIHVISKVLLPDLSASPTEVSEEEEDDVEQDEDNYENDDWEDEEDDNGRRGRGRGRRR